MYTQMVSSFYEWFLRNLELMILDEAMQFDE